MTRLAQSMSRGEMLRRAAGSAAALAFAANRQPLLESYQANCKFLRQVPG